MSKKVAISIIIAFVLVAFGVGGYLGWWYFVVKPQILEQTSFILQGLDFKVPANWQIKTIIGSEVVLLNSLEEEININL